MQMGMRRRTFDFVHGVKLFELPPFRYWFDFVFLLKRFRMNPYEIPLSTARFPITVCHGPGAFRRIGSERKGMIWRQQLEQGGAE